MGLVNLLFSYQGRISRTQYWAGSTLLTLCGFIAFMPFTGPSMKGAPPATLALGALLALSLLALCTWCNFALQVKRLHDRGRSGYFAVLLLVPLIPLITIVAGALSGAPPLAVVATATPLLLISCLINLAFFIDLGLMPSVEGPNKYGDPPGSLTSVAHNSVGAAAATPNAFALAGFGGAEKAIERAIAEQARQPANAPLAPPKPAPAAASPGFGRRPAR